MVRGGRSGSSSGRSSRGRGLLAASASSSSSVPPLGAAGSGEFTPPHPRVLAAGPSSVPPPVAAGSGEFTPPHPRVPGSGQSTPSPHTVVCPVPEDVVSLHEGGGSFHESTLREVWINGDKIEPAQASQFITRTIQAHFPGPIHRFNDFPMEVQVSLYQMFMSANQTLWKERALTWMRRDYWESLCNIWAAERWQQTSTTMKVNRAANPEANMHTSGSISFATHQSRLEKELKRPLTFQKVFDKTHKKKGMDQYISE
ncbi:hypothetical protein Taro_019999 [Colocasia esculenta]|uniref:Uncharacterized protein n=1 Tax=Colocasia esculenta TaxID=4460 RepID=A0A843V101_COLES|nr:hypothetical protein [Colocasia esculenta]